MKIENKISFFYQFICKKLKMYVQINAYLQWFAVLLIGSADTFEVECVILCLRQILAPEVHGNGFA